MTKIIHVNKKILNLAIPNIISNITVPLLGMVDLAIVGHLGNETYIAAIALGGMIFNFIYWNFSFLRMSTSGFTAQAYGAENNRRIMQILVRGITIAIVAALLLLLLQRPIAWFSRSIIDSGTETMNLALDYFFIRIWAVPATLMLYVTNGWFIGMQNAKTPMYVALLSNVVNILFSSLFALVLNMGIQGVALGTVVAQYCGLLLSIILFLKDYRPLLAAVEIRQSLVIHEMKNFFKVNVDIFLRNICVIAVFTFIPYISASMGDRILAVNTLLLQLFMLFSYIMDGFAYAGEASTGRFIGAKNNQSLQKAIKYLLIWGAILAFSFTAIFFATGDKILYILTDNASIIKDTMKYIHWTILIPIAGFAAFLFDGIYIGATASKAMRNIVVISTILFFVIYYLFETKLGNNSLWIALLLFLTLRSILMWSLNQKVLGLRKN